MLAKVVATGAYGREVAYWPEEEYLGLVDGAHTFRCTACDDKDGRVIYLTEDCAATVTMVEEQDEPEQHVGGTYAQHEEGGLT